jgi:hypothetical protein
MATIALATESLMRSGHIWTWEALTATNTDGAPADEKVGSIAFTEKTVTVTGNFGTSGECTIQGSNDGTNWFTLNDVFENLAVFTSAGIMLLAENPRYVRPAITAGSGAIDLDIIIAVKANLHFR